MKKRVISELLKRNELDVNACDTGESKRSKKLGSASSSGAALRALLPPPPPAPPPSPRPQRVILVPQPKRKPVLQLKSNIVADEDELEKKAAAIYAVRDDSLGQDDPEMSEAESWDSERSEERILASCNGKGNGKMYQGKGEDKGKGSSAKWRSCINCGVFEPFQFITEECCSVERGTQCIFKDHDATVYKNAIPDSVTLNISRVLNDMEAKIGETVEACEDTIDTCVFLRGSMNIIAKLCDIVISLPKSDAEDNDLPGLLAQRKELDERILKAQRRNPDESVTDNLLMS